MAVAALFLWLLSWCDGTASTVIHMLPFFSHNLHLLLSCFFSSFDSGSPIIIPKSDDDDEDLLVALVSWGELCADPQFPGMNSASYVLCIELTCLSQCVSQTNSYIPCSFYLCT